MFSFYNSRCVMLLVDFAQYIRIDVFATRDKYHYTNISWLRYTKDILFHNRYQWAMIYSVLLVAHGSLSRADTSGSGCLGISLVHNHKMFHSETSSSWLVHHKTINKSLMYAYGESYSLTMTTHPHFISFSSLRVQNSTVQYTPAVDVVSLW